MEESLSPDRTPTIDELVATKEPTVPLWPTAAKALGFGRSTAFAAVEKETWPTRIIKVGNRYRVPTAELLSVLGIDPGLSEDDNDAA